MPLLLVVEVAGPATHPPAGPGSGQAREGPLPDDVPLEFGQGPLQAGPLGLGPAGLVGVDLLAAGGLQGILLEVEVLVEGR